MILSLSEAVDLVLFIYCELGFYIFILIGLIVSNFLLYFCHLLVTALTKPKHAPQQQKKFSKLVARKLK